MLLLWRLLLPVPTGAEPGETMMVARRYLTSLYDWTGFSRRFYTSGKFEVSAIAIVALLVGLGLFLFNTGKPNWQHADLNSVWPSHSVELVDLGLAAVLLFLLLGNVFRCLKAVMGDFAFKVPLRVYAGQLKEFIVHALTQKRFGQCSDKMQWVAHLMTMTGYATAFLLVVVLLNGLTVEGLKFTAAGRNIRFSIPSGCWATMPRSPSCMGPRMPSWAA